ncbi:MAG TPA: hypothetical protein VFV65_04775 [Gemmatimonadales bacterium]|nr:hypothetical protein [Gemmatimonadales bacterium]
MNRLPRRPLVALTSLLAAVGGCSGGDGDTGPGVPVLTCAPGPAPTVMNAGEFRILDPVTSEGCVRLPPADAAGAEYLVVALSTAGQVTAGGVSVDYAFQGVAGGDAPQALTGGGNAAYARAGDPGARGAAGAFHDMLRQRERALAVTPGARPATGVSPVAGVPPVVGGKDTFSVCSNTSCTAFKTVIATARYVGSKGAIFLDDVVPSGGFSQEDIDTLGVLFDGGAAGAAPNMYQIDTTAFGRESDIDGNQRVIFLLTDVVNDLSGSCSDGSIILGFFYGGDLLPRNAGNPGSNQGEIFYGLVPKQAGGCAVSVSFVKQHIAPVFIHEFQHMISFNQHVLVHGGQASEEVWLNEGLSHFAEELGGRLLGDGPGQGQASSRLVQFGIPNLLNANDYLFNPEAHYLITPGSSSGTLEERGANWLFVRWLADHYAADSNGTSLTRQLVGTSLLGSANVQSATGKPLGELIPLWQLANYLDNLPGFVPADPRLQYPSWDFRHIYDTLNAQRPDLISRKYPLRPDSTTTGAYSRTGTLRAGSGRHLRVLQGPSGDGVDLILARRNGEEFPADRAVRFGVVRIR